MNSEHAIKAEGVQQRRDGVSGTQTEDIRPRAFIEAQERLDRIYSEILRPGSERHIVELELYDYTVLADVKPVRFRRPAQDYLAAGRRRCRIRQDMAAGRTGRRKLSCALAARARTNI